MKTITEISNIDNGVKAKAIESLCSIYLRQGRGQHYIVAEKDMYDERIQYLAASNLIDFYQCGNGTACRLTCCGEIYFTRANMNAAHKKERHVFWQ